MAQTARPMGAAQPNAKIRTAVQTDAEDSVEYAALELVAQHPAYARHRVASLNATTSNAVQTGAGDSVAYVKAVKHVTALDYAPAVRGNVPRIVKVNPAAMTVVEINAENVHQGPYATRIINAKSIHQNAVVSMTLGSANKTEPLLSRVKRVNL